MLCCLQDYFFPGLTCGLRVKVSSHVLVNEPREVTGGERAGFRIG